MTPPPRSATLRVPSSRQAPERPSDAGIGTAMRRIRRSCGFTQSDVARVLGVTYQQVQNYEKGTARVAAATLKAVADLFDVSVAAFFEDVGGMSRAEADRPRDRRDRPGRDAVRAAAET